MPWKNWTNCFKKLSNSREQIAVVEAGLPYMMHQVLPGDNVLTLIGPEGDFSKVEMESAMAVGFQKISLGKNTLRTETAGVVAAQMINSKNSY